MVPRNVDTEGALRLLLLVLLQPWALEGEALEKWSPAVLTTMAFTGTALSLEVSKALAIPTASWELSPSLPL